MRRKRNFKAWYVLAGLLLGIWLFPQPAAARECGYLFYDNGFENNEALIAKMGSKLVMSPVESEKHNKVIRTRYTTESDNYIGTEYELIQNAFESGKLQHVEIEFDILFEGYISGSVRVIDDSSPTKYGSHVVKFNSSGKMTLSNPTVTNAANWKKYQTYKTGVWYHFELGLDIEKATYDLSINGDVITQGSDLVTTGGPMKDFLHWRIYVDQKTKRNDPEKDKDVYFYLDNIKYYVPCDEMFQGAAIETEYQDGRLTVRGVAPESSGVLMLAAYQDGMLTDVKMAESVQAEEAWCIAEASIEAKGGTTIKSFLWKDSQILRPLCGTDERYIYSDAEYEALREKWSSFLVGDKNMVLTDRAKTCVDKINSTAKTRQSTMNRKSGATSLWGASYKTSADLVTEYGKIYDMAKAWSTPGQSLYHDDTLAEDIHYALEWMYQNRYGQAEIDDEGWRLMTDYNWHDWYVKVPRYLVDIFMILGSDVIPQADIEEYLTPFDYITKIMRLDTKDESNVNGRAYNVFAAGVLKKDAEQIKEMLDIYPVLFETVQSGTGMYEDYSYVKHNMIAYTGVYGTGALLDRIVQIMAITAGTPFELPQLWSGIYEGWIYNAFEPLMVDGGIMSMVRGRSVADSSEISDGVTVIQSMLNMLDAVGPEDARRFEEILRWHLQKEDRLSYVYNHLELPQIIRLEQVMAGGGNDPIPGDSTRVYYNMDRIVHHRSDYHLGIAMSSSRIAGYESINHANLRGWYTGDGMVYLYTGAEQYNMNYFKYADPYKRPGTTVDTQERKAVSIAFGREYFSGQDFVGGTSLDTCSVGAMALESFHNDTLENVEDTGAGGALPLHDCDLVGRKSWFLFDDEIVCVGSGIAATGSAEVLTVVENRQMDSTDGVLINGQPAETNNSTESPRWAYLPGTGGYYFPQGGSLVSQTVRNTKTFFEMWLQHGTHPINASYAYTILPGMTSEETEKYAAQPGAEVLCNTERVHAVSQKEKGLIGYVFWEADCFDGISVDAPVIMLVRRQGENVTVSLSDPTHKLKQVQVTLDGMYILKETQFVTAETRTRKTSLRYDLSGANGKEIVVQLKELKG